MTNKSIGMRRPVVPIHTKTDVTYGLHRSRTTRRALVSASNKRLIEFSAIEARISVVQAVWLLDIIDPTTEKAETVRDKLEASDADVNWSNADVVRAVEDHSLSDGGQAMGGDGAGWSTAPAVAVFGAAV